MKISRLLAITNLLLTNQSLTAGDLAKKFEVSTRTIFRDVEILSAAGVPVYMQKGAGGGIRLLDEYVMQRSLLTSSEIDALLLSLEMLGATRAPGIEPVLNKLGALFKPHQPIGWVEVEFSPWGSQPDEENKFNLIKTSILDRTLLEFDYVNSQGEFSHRCVEPIQFIFKSNAWYLRAFCQTRQDFRTFRLSRLHHVASTKISFAPRTDPARSDPTAASVSQPDLVTLKLKFSSDLRHIVYDTFSPSQVIIQPDGSSVVTINLLEDGWSYNFLLSFGCGLEVLEPPAFRNGLAKRLQNMLKKYQE